MTAEELLHGVRKMYLDFYSTPYTMRRVIKSLNLGVSHFL